MTTALPEIIGGKYKVLAQIGKGGMATVYSAVHLGTDRRVAVKVMASAPVVDDIDSSSASDQASLLLRFEREARIAGNVETQHVTRVFDTGLDPEHGPFIVMELLRGEDLKDLILRLGPLRPDLALRIVGQACIGIGRAHALGVVHRDVKASNLFLAADEFGALVVKVLDFGIAKGRLSDAIDATDSKTLTKTGAMLGSPHYMSPEQVLGTKALDHRADIWSLGIVLYKCLSARTPFDDRDTIGQIVVSIVQGTPPSVQDFAPWVSADITAIIVNALQARPQDRYQSAEDMHQAIRALVRGGDLQITPAMLTPMTDDERRDVKARLSTRVLAPGAPRSTRRLSNAWTPAPSARHTGDGDSTIGSATASLRRPSGPPSRGAKAGMIAAVALATGAVAIWGLAHRDGASSPPVVEPASSAAAASSSAQVQVPPAPSPAASAALERHVDVQVHPATASVDVDGAPAVVTGGTVPIVGELGSIHKVHVHSGAREVTMEVIVAEDGARPHLVALPDLRVEAAPPPLKAPPTKPAAAPAPQPAKSAARFDTQFE